MRAAPFSNHAPCSYFFRLACLPVLWLAVGFAVAQAQTPATPPTASVPLNALRFSGLDAANAPQTGQGVTVPEVTPSPFNASGALTLEVWVKVSSWTKRFQAIVTKGDAWGILRADTGAKICFRTEVSGQSGV